MRGRLKKVLIGILLFILAVCIFVLLLSRKSVPETITYGISFNAPYAEELGLEVNEVFDAFIDELGVKHFRLAAHWPKIEPRKDVYDFTWLDYQIERVEESGGDVIFGVGRRLPRWPECHIPGWAGKMTWDEQKEEIRDYIKAVVTRYKDSPAILYWQVENEPYLGVFATEYCDELDEAFLEEEIALVRSIDPTRPILVTDSGNLGTWNGAYTHGDVFGTSVYVYFWNPDLGQFRTILPPAYYRVKENIMKLLHGKKDTLLIELSLEPWLLDPVVNVPIDVQYSRMDAEKFDSILEYAKKTRYDRQYLWGGEWWYWLKTEGNDEMWEKGKLLFKK